jgi:hypothetical protein
MDKLNEVFTDQDGKLFKYVRIRHVIILGTRSFLLFFSMAE